MEIVKHWKPAILETAQHASKAWEARNVVTQTITMLCPNRPQLLWSAICTPVGLTPFATNTYKVVYPEDCALVLSSQETGFHNVSQDVWRRDPRAAFAVVCSVSPVCVSDKQ